MSTLSKRIKLLRQNKHITQDELAKHLHVKRSTLANWEISRTEPNIDTIQKLADFFKVSVDYLLGRTDDPSPTIKKATSQEILEIVKKEGIMFDGTPLDEEDKREIIDVMKIAWKIIQEKKRIDKQNKR